MSLAEPWEARLAALNLLETSVTATDRMCLAEEVTRAMLDLDGLEIPAFCEREGPLRNARRTILRRLSSIADACDHMEAP